MSFEIKDSRDHNRLRGLTPETPAFVLTADDPLASILVQLWAHLSAESGHVPESVVTDAICCAGRMRLWRLRARDRKRVRIFVPEDSFQETLPKETCESQPETKE